MNPPSFLPSSPLDSPLNKAPHLFNISYLFVVSCFCWIQHIFTASIPTAAVTSRIQTPSSIVFPTKHKDAVVDLLGIPSCRRNARIVSLEYFVAANVAAGEDSPTKEAIDCVVLY